MKKILLGIVAAAFASSAAYAAADAVKKCCCEDMKGKAEQPAPKK
jgi:opacity protein-like surface antigen